MPQRDGGLRQIFRDCLPLYHWQSIETGSTGRGIPDANYCSDGVEGWVEFKRTEGWAVGVRPEQVAWHLRRARAGGRTTIAVRRKTDELWLVPGSQADRLRAGGLRAVVASHWAGGPGAWDWAAVNNWLKGPVLGPK